MNGEIRRDTRNGVRREKFQREEAESWSDEAESQACAVLRVRIKTYCDAEQSKTRASSIGERRYEKGGSNRMQTQFAALAQRVSGDNSLRDPPVPIPNTEVKPQHADSTWLETAREGRSSPDSIRS